MTQIGSVYGEALYELALSENLTALLLAQIGRAKQPEKIGLCLEAFVQYQHLAFDFLNQVFTEGQLIKSLAIYASNLGHT